MAKEGTNFIDDGADKEMLRWLKLIYVYWTYKRIAKVLEGWLRTKFSISLWTDSIILDNNDSNRHLYLIYYVNSSYAVGGISLNNGKFFEWHTKKIWALRKSFLNWVKLKCLEVII